MTQTIIVEKYQKKYREALLDLWDEVFPGADDRNQPAFMLDEKLKVDDLIFIAHVNDILLGACMAGYDGHRGWLYAVAVHSDARRQGVGRLLIQESLKQLDALGCVKVNLQIRSDNQGVKGFYESLGFCVEERLSMGKLLKS